VTAPAGPPGVEIRDIGRRFGRITALRGVSLGVAPGERVAIFGPNGSGKTTLLRVLAGLTRPTKGSLSIGGLNYHRHGLELRRRVGVVAHHSYLYEDLTAEENLLFYGRMFGVEQPERRVGLVLELVGMEHRRRDPVRTLSRGMQQRLALARAVIHDPDVLLLDEPDTGLDQKAVAQMGDLFQKEGGGNRTVLLATHDLRVGMQSCARFAILANGRIVHEGEQSGESLADLEELYRSHASTN
jgi:heme exporter protein A